MLAYADAGAAIAWLCDAFGFREREAARQEENGVVIHAELVLDDSTVMLATPSPEYEGPRLHAEHCERARRWLDHPWVVDGLLVRIDDADAHHARAVAAGANVIRPPEDVEPAGMRLYTVEDIEGHRWMFGAPL